MFIPTCVTFYETMCDQMMKNDFPLCEFLLVETINTGAKHCLNTTVSHIRLCLIIKPLTPLKKFSQSSWGCLYIQARAADTICIPYTK
jgi:hypothetical protein